mmetsp:Transcript_3426/g.5137  ORF Transcript_3426/g.5137 Transcript_3426/m.5137 type:complete len:221 (-) Transcript_3426:194-856(-)
MDENSILRNEDDDTSQIVEDSTIQGAIDDELIMSILSHDGEFVVSKKDKYLLPFRPRSSSDSSVEENINGQKSDIGSSERFDENIPPDDDNFDKMNDYQTLTNLDDDADEDFGDFHSSVQINEISSNESITTLVMDQSVEVTTSQFTTTTFEQFADFDSNSLPPVYTPLPFVSIPPLSPEKVDKIKALMSNMNIKTPMNAGIDCLVKQLERAKLRVGDEF